MLNKVLDVVKNPVTNIIEKSEKVEMKKEVIKVAIMSLIISLINLISTVISIITKFTRKDFWYKNYSSSELWEKRFEAMGKEELFSSFFKSFIITLIAIAVIAGILFLIVKIVKSKKSYAKMLSIVNNVVIISVVGSVLKLVLSFIYEPLALFVMFGVSVYAFFSLIFAFRDSLDIENANALVLATTVVLSIVLVIIVIIFCAINGIALSGISGFADILS